MGGCRTHTHPPHAWVPRHLLVESLVFYPALPEVLAGFWRRGEIGKNNFLFLKEKDKESAGEQESGAHRARAGNADGGQSRRAALAWGRSSTGAPRDTGRRWSISRHPGMAPRTRDGQPCAPVTCHPPPPLTRLFEHPEILLFENHAHGLHGSQFQPEVFRLVSLTRADRAGWR